MDTPSDTTRCLALAAGLLVVLGSGCGREPQTSASTRPSAPVAVEVAPARQLPIQRSVAVVGTLFGDEEVTIAAKVAGRVQQTAVEMGDRVAPGEALGRLEATDYELAVKQAQSALTQTLSRLGLKELPKPDFDVAVVATVKQAALQAANAQARFARAEKLYRQQPPLISEQDFADAQTAAAVAHSAADVAALAAQTTLAEVEARQVDLAVRQQLLADTTLRAPGVASAQKKYAVAARLVNAGDYVREGSPMFRLVADNPVRYRASVPERYLAEVALGQKVTITIEGRSEAVEGTLKRINPEIDAASRSFQVEILADNGKGLLRPGAFARGTIATYVDDKALLIPQSAVASFAGIRKVYTLRDGKVVENEVALGASRGDLVEITSGLQPGAQVIVAGPARLASGITAEIKPQPAATMPR